MTAAEEVAESLARSPRRLPSRFFYDEEGARLFEEITRLDEYYLTGAESGILEARVSQVAGHVGPKARVVEYGSGSGDKTRLLLDRLEAPAAYVPVDVARRQLAETARRMAERYPGLEVLPVAADYTRLETLPQPKAPIGTTLAFFPGSTIGNFEPEEAVRFLRRIGGGTGPGAFLLIGVDLVKDRRVLERAYDDAAGVTARFNLNILVHLNRILGAGFDPDAFWHRAVWNAEASRIEMHLVSERRQEIALGPSDDAPRIRLEEGEAIVTEHSYKYRPEAFRDIAERAGYRPVESWTDRRELFGVHLMQWAG